MNAKLDAWRERVKRLDVAAPPSRGALWTGLGAEKSRDVAARRGLTTLEMTPGGASLDRGDDKAKLDADFGPDWGTEKKQVWTWLSRCFAAQLSGHVTVLVKSKELTNGVKAERARIDAKIIWDESIDVNVLGDLTRNPKITKLTVVEVEPSGIASFTYPVPLSSFSH